MKIILKLPNREHPAAAHPVRLDADETCVGKGISGGRSYNNVVMHIGKNGVSENHEVAIGHSDPRPHRHLFRPNPPPKSNQNTKHHPESKYKRLPKGYVHLQQPNIIVFIVKCPAFLQHKKVTPSCLPSQRTAVFSRKINRF